MKVRFEFETEIAEPETVEKAHAAVAKLTPKGWKVKDTKFCTRLEQVTDTTFRNARLIVVIAEKL